MVQAFRRWRIGTECRRRKGSSVVALHAALTQISLKSLGGSIEGFLFQSGIDMGFVLKYDKISFHKKNLIVVSWKFLSGNLLAQIQFCLRHDFTKIVTDNAR